MLKSCQTLQAKIFHRRHFPTTNSFGYRLFYIAVPLSRVESLSRWPLFGVNRSAVMSFWNKDHGDQSGAELRSWADRVLIAQGVEDADGEVVLVTLPRLLGYVFNPVSFWLCYTKNGALRAVIAQVNNTFGETHSYVCAGEPGENISARELFFADKEFHVSPFLRREGSYRFNFAAVDEKLSIKIDYFDENDNLQLQTSISGHYNDWRLANILRSWINSPLMALKAISLIHWQALKLFVKSVKFQPKPEQKRWFYTRARSHLDRRRLDNSNNQIMNRANEEPHVLEYR